MDGGVELALEAVGRGPNVLLYVEKIGNGEEGVTLRAGRTSVGK